MIAPLQVRPEAFPRPRLLPPPRPRHLSFARFFLSLPLLLREVAIAVQSCLLEIGGALLLFAEDLEPDLLLAPQMNLRQRDMDSVRSPAQPISALWYRSVGVLESGRRRGGGEGDDGDRPFAPCYQVFRDTSLGRQSLVVPQTLPQDALERGLIPEALRVYQRKGR